MTREKLLRKWLILWFIRIALCAVDWLLYSFGLWPKEPHFVILMNLLFAGGVIWTCVMSLKLCSCPHCGEPIDKLMKLLRENEEVVCPSCHKTVY